MSFSFGFVEDTRPSAKLRLIAEMAKIVARDASHETDHNMVVAAIGHAIDSMAEPSVPSKKVAVSASGSVSGRWKLDRIVEVNGIQLQFSVQYVNP